MVRQYLRIQATILFALFHEENLLAIVQKHILSGLVSTVVGKATISLFTSGSSFMISPKEEGRFGHDLQASK